MQTNKTTNNTERKMKKLLNISVIAALTILPLAASATDYAIADPTAANPATTASTGPGWALAQENSTADGKVATAGYVKGAYNQAMKAINTVAATAGSAVQSVAAGSTNGTIKVNNGADITIYDDTDLQTDVSGLKSTVGNSTSGLVKDVTDLQTTVGDSTSGLVKDVDALETTVGDSTSGLVKDVTDLQTDVGALQTASGNYATKTGVENTISASTTSSSIDVVTTWGTDATTPLAISGTVTSGSYATANQ
ncbi:MAG: hypothetical protein J6T57_02525 [Alphaproteobacteria bacterium]|nr:hypothetical protein [Alphaproteobacteria bacterium]